MFNRFKMKIIKVISLKREVSLSGYFHGSLPVG